MVLCFSYFSKVFESEPDLEDLCVCVCVWRGAIAVQTVGLLAVGWFFFCFHAN